MNTEVILFSATSIALLVSLVAEIKKRGKDSIPRIVWKYFSYYTTLTNILVLVWFGALAFLPQHTLGKLALDSNIAAAITFYIFTVGVANYLIYGWKELAFLDRMADLLVHSLTPIITLLYWLYAADKDQLQHSLIGYWLVYPLVYALYTMVHGKWTRFYPYEFTNIQALGFKRVAFNALGLTFSLLIGGTIFILFGEIIG